MPVTALVAVLAGFSMAGFPPFLGFIGKELKYEGALAISDAPWLVVAGAVSANAMMVAVALTIVFRVFLGGRADETPRAPREAVFLMWIGPLLLAVGGLLTGVFPELVAATVIEPAIERILARETDVYLSLWHGINIPLVLSVVTVVIGVLLFLRLPSVRAWIVDLLARSPVTGDSAYGSLLEGTTLTARRATDRIQSGSLSRYLSVVFVVLIAGVGAALLGTNLLGGVGEMETPTLTVVVVTALIALAAGATTVARSRMLSICLLGIVGSGLALLFLMFGAIDVAITQLMVETLFVVLIAAVLPKLPMFAGAAHPGRAGTLRDASIAVGAGVVVALVVFGVANTPTDLTVTHFYEAASLTKAYGRNIVNVILVDFRALDTLGEIVVVAAAAMAVIALLKVRPRHPPRVP